MPLALAAVKRAWISISPRKKRTPCLEWLRRFYARDWCEAERHFRLAVAREPVPAYVRWYYSFSSVLPMGRPRESVQQCLRGLQDDPLKFLGGFHYADALLAAGNANAGEAHLRQLSEVHAILYQPYYLVSPSQTLRGLHKDARAAAEKAYSLALWSATTTGLFAVLRSDSRWSSVVETLGPSSAILDD